jgi:hypothetical protein
MKTYGTIHFDAFDVVHNDWFNKTHFLYFDKIYFDLIALKPYENIAQLVGKECLDNLHNKLKELEELQKLGLYEETGSQNVLKHTHLLNAHELELCKKFVITSNQVFNDLEPHFLKTFDQEWLKYYCNFERIGQEFFSQVESVILQKKLGVTCIPIIRTDNRLVNKNFSELQRDYLAVIYKFIPTLPQDTPWEKILEFKNDPDSKLKFIALKDWLNDISKSNISEIELTEKIEHNLNEYRKHMNFHKIKHTTGTLELFLSTTADILESLVKLKFSNIIKTLFDINKQQLALIEAEINAPHKEVAYFDKLAVEFKNNV